MAKQSDQLSFGLIILDPDAYRIQSMRRLRTCLCGLSDSCKGEFMSFGPGNRICPPCRAVIDPLPTVSECPVITAAF